MLGPGSTIGMLGSGQLGRMFAFAAHRLGYTVHTFSPDPNSPANQATEKSTKADYTDLTALGAFVAEVDVVTLEFENIPTSALEYLSGHVPVHPGANALAIAQNRLKEKNYLSENGFPVAPFAHVKTEAEFKQAAAEIGVPSVLKTSGFGYDGKGQIKLNNQDDIDKAWSLLSSDDAVIEKWISYKDEVSIIAARNLQGETAFYPVIHNTHRNHILDVSIFPAPSAETTQAQAEDIAKELMKKLNYVGLLCIEFFRMDDDSLLVNELAPRTHNSGHVTIEAAATGQFEQQVRAVCGLPLGSTAPIKKGTMLNLLGDLWKDGEPDWAPILKMPEVYLHLYGKEQARPGRKMGHITVLGDQAEETVAEIKSILSFR